MTILSEAARALTRNAGATCIYLVLSGGTIAIKRVGDLLIASGVTPSLSPALSGGYEFLSTLFIALGITAASVAAFSRMGQEIDRPLWKLSGDREAFKRFSLIWFLITISFLTVISLFERVASANPASSALSLLQLLYFLMFLFAVPVGACIMFAGHFQWSTLLHDLAPLARQLRQTLAVVFINFLAFAWHLTLADFLVDRPGLRAKLWVLALMDIPFGVVDCYVFAGIWLICMLHRKDEDLRARDSDYELL